MCRSGQCPPGRLGHRKYVHDDDDDFRCVFRISLQHALRNREGAINGQAGAQAEWTFLDNGQPGVAKDVAHVLIKSASGETVLETSGQLIAGDVIAK